MMSNDDLREQIDALRLEVRKLNDSFVSLRDEDIRKVMVQQARPVLVERIDRVLGWSNSVDDRACRDALVRWTDEAFEALERGGRAGGLRFLEGRRARSVIGQCDRPEVGGLADDLEAQMRSYLDTYSAVLRFPGARERPRADETSIGRLSPDRVEEMLSPLSSRVRITIMQHLSAEDDGLASMSRALGLQKGHLQFHLRSLLDGGYIDYDRKSRLYSLSGRGKRALDGLARLMDDLMR
jgi:DNA-binding transcriptional ArsR family regulator